MTNDGDDDDDNAVVEVVIIFQFRHTTCWIKNFLLSISIDRSIAAQA